MSYNEDEYEEFAKRMETQFPKMFSNPYGGFAVGKGWWPIIESLCGQIHNHVEWKQNQKEKYERGDGCPDVVVEQIKEKFGGLRFYYQGGDDTVDGMVRMAESWASRSCEECGKPGTSRSGGWVRTLCDEHEEERQRNMRNRYGEDS
jgi:hypothetical protein